MYTIYSLSLNNQKPNNPCQYTTCEYTLSTTQWLNACILLQPCTSGPATLCKSFLASKTSSRLNPEFLSWGPDFLLLHHYHVTGFQNQET